MSSIQDQIEVEVDSSVELHVITLTGDTIELPGNLDACRILIISYPEFPARLPPSGHS
jgi:hypothetical protein